MDIEQALKRYNYLLAKKRQLAQKGKKLTQTGETDLVLLEKDIEIYTLKQKLKSKGVRDEE